MCIMAIPTITLLVTFATFSSIQGLQGDNKGKLEPIGTTTGFNNAKEREEFFQKLKETHIPLRETGLPIANGKDNPDNFEDFVEDVDVHEDTFTRKRSNSKKVQNDDDLESLADNGIELDARLPWPCRRRRWWGSCAARRRAGIPLPKRIRISVKRRRRNRMCN